MKARWTLSLPQTSRANPVQCCSTHQQKCAAVPINKTVISQQKKSVRITQRLSCCNILRQTNIVTRSRAFSGSWQMHLFVMTRMIHLCVYPFFDGYCSTVQGLLDWFEVDLGFTELSFIQIDLCVLYVFVLYSRVSLSSCPFWTFRTASPARWECL